MTKFSIIIPVYNREKLIKRAIESVIHQSYKKWECLVIDDNSTDLTRKSINDYIKNDSRIKVFRSKKAGSGAPACRNIGIKKSTGTHIIFLDSDDFFMPWALEERNAFIISNPENIFFLSQGLNYEKNGKLMLRGNPKKKDYINEFITFQTAFQTTAPTWHKSFLIEVGMWNEDIKRWQDPEIHIRALIKTNNVIWKSEIPDYALTVDNNDECKITNIDRAIKNYDNLISAYMFSIKFLNKSYINLFHKHILHQAWCFGEHLNYAQLQLVSEKLYRNQVLNKKKYRQYYFTILLMIITKKIPLVRKLIYNQIKKNTLKVEHYIEYIDHSVIDQFKDKVTQFGKFSYLQEFNQILNK